MHTAFSFQRNTSKHFPKRSQRRLEWFIYDPVSSINPLSFGSWSLKRRWSRYLNKMYLLWLLIGIQETIRFV